MMKYSYFLYGLIYKFIAQVRVYNKKNFICMAPLKPEFTKCFVGQRNSRILRQQHHKMAKLQRDIIEDKFKIKLKQEDKRNRKYQYK